MREIAVDVHAGKRPVRAGVEPEAVRCAGDDGEDTERSRSVGDRGDRDGNRRRRDDPRRLGHADEREGSTAAVATRRVAGEYAGIVHLQPVGARVALHLVERVERMRRHVTTECESRRAERDHASGRVDSPLRAGVGGSERDGGGASRDERLAASLHGSSAVGPVASVLVGRGLVLDEHDVRTSGAVTHQSHAVDRRVRAREVDVGRRCGAALNGWKGDTRELVRSGIHGDEGSGVDPPDRSRARVAFLHPDDCGVVETRACGVLIRRRGPGHRVRARSVEEPHAVLGRCRLVREKDALARVRHGQRNAIEDGARRRAHVHARGARGACCFHLDIGHHFLTSHERRHEHVVGVGALRLVFTV